jgi:hypothetical protein
MLLTNASPWSQYPVTMIGGPVSSQLAMWFRHETLNAAFDKSSSTPAGYLAPAALRLPIASGGMAVLADGIGSITVTLTPSYPMQASLTGTGDLDALAALAVSMAASLSGSGTLSATVIGQLNAVVAMAGSGNLTGAMAGLATMVADLEGTGDLDALMTGIASMSIDIVVTGAGLTTENIAAAVWSHFNVDAETGEQLLKALKAAKLAAALSA